MEFFKSLVRKYKYNKSIADAEKIRSLCSPFLDEVVNGFTLESRRSISEWDLSNPILLNYLGYIAGVIDAAEQHLISQGKIKATNDLPAEIVFHLEMKKTLALTEGIEEFLDTHLVNVHGGNSAIGWLQKKDGFLDAMTKGGRDFCSLGGPNYLPMGLIELGLAYGGQLKP